MRDVEKGDTLYYSQGVTDPDYCVLRFTTQRGRYYRNFASENFDLVSSQTSSASE